MNNSQLFWFDNVELRPHPWPGLNWVTTIIQVPDVQEARNIYVNIFKFVPIFENTEPQNPNNIGIVRLRYRGANFVLSQEGSDYEGVAPVTSKSPPPFVFYLYVDDVDEVYHHALLGGMKSVKEPDETPWGDRRARLRCPFGYIWDIAQRVK